MTEPIQGQTGPQGPNQDGSIAIFRAGKLGEQMTSQLQARFYEQCYRGNMYSGGMALTSISNAIWTTATTDATSKGIVGIYNPSSSGVNAVLLQAHVNCVITAATNTGCGGFNWMSATGQSGLTLGSTPLNRLTLAASGSKCKDMSGIALTGLSGASSVRQGSSISTGSSANFSFVGTAAGQATANVAGFENFDGGLIVPPGGVFFLAANTTPVAHSAVSGLLWVEVPV